MAHDFTIQKVAFRNPWYTMFDKDGWFSLRPNSDLDGGACLVMDCDENVLLVEIYRHPVDKVMLELPRGGADESDESSIETALREAKEETGVVFDEARIIDLGLICPDDGILTTEVRLVAAVLPGRISDIEIDPSEVLGYRIVPFDEVKEMVVKEEIQDGITLSAVLLMDQHMQAGSTESQEIEILTADGEVVARITTRRPEWSFDQYCCNRDSGGRIWRRKT